MTCGSECRFQVGGEGKKNNKKKKMEEAAINSGHATVITEGQWLHKRPSLPSPNARYAHCVSSGSEVNLESSRMTSKQQEGNNQLGAFNEQPPYLTSLSGQNCHTLVKHLFLLPSTALPTTPLFFFFHPEGSHEQRCESAH